jgi:hypothetical protein
MCENNTYAISRKKLYKYCEIWASWTLKMEAGISLEESVIIFQFTRHYTSEYTNLL